MKRIISFVSVIVLTAVMCGCITANAATFNDTRTGAYIYVPDDWTVDTQPVGSYSYSIKHDGLVRYSTGFCDQDGNEKINFGSIDLLGTSEYSERKDYQTSDFVNELENCMKYFSSSEKHPEKYSVLSRAFDHETLGYLPMVFLSGYETVNIYDKECVLVDKSDCKIYFCVRNGALYQFKLNEYSFNSSTEQPEESDEAIIEKMINYSYFPNVPEAPENEDIKAQSDEDYSSYGKNSSKENNTGKYFYYGFLILMFSGPTLFAYIRKRYYSKK